MYVVRFGTAFKSYMWGKAWDFVLVAHVGWFGMIDYTDCLNALPVAVGRFVWGTSWCSLLISK